MGDPKNDKYTLADKDHLEMYKWYQDRATSVKGAMFSSFTWAIGIATAILAFTYNQIADFDKEKQSDLIGIEELITILCISGIVICVYSWFVLLESSKHIKENWKKGGLFLERIDDEIINPPEKKKTFWKKFLSFLKAGWLPVWWRLAIISFLIFFAFVYTLVKF